MATAVFHLAYKSLRLARDVPLKHEANRDDKAAVSYLKFM